MSPTRTDREYAHLLDDLRRRLLGMARMVESMIDDALNALLSGSEEQARAIMQRDAKVDASEIEIDDLCRAVLARYQPMASDLRFVATTMKMVTDLERIGDLAVNVCERVVAHGKPVSGQLESDLREMGRQVRDLLSRAVDAYLQGDAAAARQVCEDDDGVDDLYTDIFRKAVELMREHPEQVPDGMNVVSVIKWLERMGDHATNLAEHAVFLIDGKDIRHEGKRPSNMPGPK